MTLAKCRGEDPEGGPDVLGGGIKGSLCGGGWVSETRGLSWWPVGDKSRFDDLSDGNPGENASSSAGANAPGWVVPLPMSDSNLSPFAGSRVKSPATGRTSCGRRTVPTEYPIQGMQEIWVCCASSAGSSGHRQIACLLLREHLRSRAQNGDADAGSMAAVRGSGHRRKMRFGVWERRVQSNRPDDGAGGAWGGECRKVTPPQPPTSSHRLDFFATPCRPGLSPLLPSRHEDGPPPWTPASRKDTLDIRVLLRPEAEGRGLRHGAMGQSRKKKKNKRHAG